MKINPIRADYIKLGSNGGEWERECIYDKQILKLGYREIDHYNCLNKEWDKVEEQCARFRSDKGAISRDVKQIRMFYEDGEDVLWVTFHANQLWWCFSKSEVTQGPNNTKIRQVNGKWRCKDINEHSLQMDQLSGSLLSMEGFRGTICSVKEFKYLINKINGIIPKEIEETQAKLSELEKSLETIIKNLNWKDFEILIDLIFRQAGWQRVSRLGGIQKTIDLDLRSPITEEMYAVQVKSQAGLSQFKEYQEKFQDMKGYSKIYFVVHKPDSDLKNYNMKDDAFELIFSHKIARLAVKYGLTEWIMNKG
jgi:hypothetical protein